MILEMIKPCPCCGASSTHYHDTEYQTPDEIACHACGFEWQQSRCSMWPDDEAWDYREMYQGVSNPHRFYRLDEESETIDVVRLRLLLKSKRREK